MLFTAGTGRARGSLKWEGGHIVRKMRHYLMFLVIPAHRRAFTSIMFSSNAFAVERLRCQWGERYRAPVPREWRLCRFCRASVEDEVHALMECRGDNWHDLVSVREAMRLDVTVTVVIPDFSWHWDSRTLLLHLRMS